MVAGSEGSTAPQGSGEGAKPAAARKASSPEPTTKAAEPSGPSFKKLLEQAEAALRAEKSKEAEKQFRAVLAADPKSAEAHSGLAMALYNLARDSAAGAEAKQAIALDPSSARAHLVAGLVATNRQDIAAAKGAYHRYLELAPTGEYAEEVRRFLKAQK